MWNKSIQDSWKAELNFSSMNPIKIVGYASVFLLVLNLILFSLRVYSALVFWIILTIVSLAAFGLLKVLKEKKGKRK